MAIVVEEQLVVGGTYDLNVTIEKGGVAWGGLSAENVVFILTSPGEVSVQKVPTVLDASAGRWKYKTLVTDFSEPGDWELSVRVKDTSVNPNIEVESGPAILSVYGARYVAPPP